MSEFIAKSKPTYERLQVDALGQEHIFIGTREAWPTLQRNLKICNERGLKNVSAHWLFNKDLSHRLESPTACYEHICVYEDEESLLRAVRETAEKSFMGARFYVVGPEIFLWTVSNLLRELGVSKEEAQLEACGSKDRRVFCAHCRTICDAVHTNIVECKGCNRVLFVRDHFSRRLNAYLGVRADAERPGTVPKAEVFT